jgi:hypothetical protein
MSKTVKRVLLVASLLYATSFVTCLTGNELNPIPLYLEDVSPPWTAWDYVSCVLLLFAVDSTLAAVWLQSDGNSD